MAVNADKIAMVILVKNEIDIIELNIRFHQAMGIQRFVIMDNGSTDGTLECLKALKETFDIHLVENPTGVYQQSKWMTDLAKLARQQYGVTHVIPNDADEFWVPEDGKSLPDAIDDEASVQTVHRYNRVLTRSQIEQGVPFYETDFYALSPILYSGETQKFKPNISMQLVKVSPKVIVKPQGLIKIKGGNHRADHWAVWRKRKNTQITVHHFPIRSYEQFLANIENRDHLLDKPNVKMGPHYRRWVKQLREGTLKEEFARMAPTAEQLAVLEQVGVVARDSQLPALLKSMAPDR